MRVLIACALSALLGGMVALAVHAQLTPPGDRAEPAPAVIPRADTPPAATAPRASGPGASGAAAVAPSRSVAPRLPHQDDDRITPEERVNIVVYEEANRGVVYINTRSVRTDSFFLVEVPSEGEGSGSVLDRQGHILTNFHVIEGAREIQVTLFDGKTYDAQLVGQDPTNDVAVLKIHAPADSLFPIELGDSTNLRVGQRVFAIGNPFGMERTLTTGIISSLNRALPSRNGRIIKQVIQTDAAINPGNSGGPLLDSYSRLIGMNTAIASRAGQSSGIGFAIPANTIARIVPQLIEKGRVVRADAGIARFYETERGLLIATLVPGGPADLAGLRGPEVRRERRQQGLFVYEYRTLDRTAADLIVAVDGTPVQTVDDFLSLVESKQPGEEVTITVVRRGQQEEIQMTLGESES